MQILIITGSIVYDNAQKCRQGWMSDVTFHIVLKINNCTQKLW